MVLTRMMFLSDHASVILSIDLLDHHKTPYQWRLNKSLLLDMVTMADVRGGLLHYFQENSTPDSSEMMI